ncbi:hypothetical protein GGR54DRAFT_219243 [Hypoxylon sp. NC1633]|nr:hypothetical protein GGR54DRAFT_219243 [Hypoxylon sp. NC1633]
MTSVEFLVSEKFIPAKELTGSEEALREKVFSRLFAVLSDAFLKARNDFTPFGASHYTIVIEPLLPSTSLESYVVPEPTRSPTPDTDELDEVPCSPQSNARTSTTRTPLPTLSESTPSRTTPGSPVNVTSCEKSCLEVVEAKYLVPIPNHPQIDHIKNLPARNDLQGNTLSNRFKQPNLKRIGNIKAALMQVAGQLAKVQCRSCQKGNGPWVNCVLAPGNGLLSACANCFYNGRAKHCEFYRKDQRVTQYIYEGSEQYAPEHLGFELRFPFFLTAEVGGCHMRCPGPGLTLKILIKDLIETLVLLNIPPSSAATAMAKSLGTPLRP